MLRVTCALVLLVVVAGAPINDEPPLPEDGGVVVAGGGVKVYKPHKPFSFGLNIPSIFNMKLHTHQGGTALGIDIPAVFSFGMHHAKPFFPAGPPGPGFFGPPADIPPEEPIDIKKKPHQALVEP